MRYFLDTEFLEGIQKTWFGQTKPTIDLISIGIVCEDGREYYAISKDFNLKEAWNRCDLKERKDYENFSIKEREKILYDKEYWLRDNVLKPIFIELYNKEYLESCKLGTKTSIVLNKFEKENNLSPNSTNHVKFDYTTFKSLISKYGKTSKQIAEEIKDFVYSKEDVLYNHEDCKTNHIGEVRSNIQFYGYYCDYDWVVFCWLFGRMIDLPKGFPMYCIDLKQMLDERANKYVDDNLKEPIVSSDWHSNYCINELKRLPNYPKQTNEHNALADAKWNFELYKFLNTI